MTAKELTGKTPDQLRDSLVALTKEAFNALLKTLEEPPSHVLFILATTEKHKILPTILSRCQVFDFRRIMISDITRHLAGIAQTEGIEAEAQALHVIAQKADGGLRDAVAEKVHVEHHGDAAGEVFHNGELRQHIDVIRSKLCLLGKHLLGEPSLERQIVRKRTQKRHAAVRMGVFKARHEQVTVTVYLAIRFSRIATLFSEGDDAAAGDDELA